MKKLFKVKVTQEFVAYLDDDIKDENLTDYQNITLSKVLAQTARDFPYGTSNTVKITTLRSLTQLPREWDEGCIPYGRYSVKGDIKSLLLKQRKR